MYDKEYTLYRKVKTGKIRTYSTNATYTDVCSIQPVNIDVEIWLDNLPSFEASRLYTENLDILTEDKVVIDSIEYIVSWTPKKYQWILKNNLIALIKKKYD